MFHCRLSIASWNLASNALINSSSQEPDIVEESCLIRAGSENILLLIVERSCCASDIVISGQNCAKSFKILVVIVFKSGVIDAPLWFIAVCRFLSSLPTLKLPSTHVSSQIFHP